MADMIIEGNGGPAFPQSGRGSTQATYTEESFKNAVALAAAGQWYEPGGKVMVVASVPGNVELTLASGPLTVPVGVGVTYFPFRCTGWVQAGTTATAQIYNLS